MAACGWGRWGQQISQIIATSHLQQPCHPLSKLLLRYYILTIKSLYINQRKLSI
jgi:hypothetical protein